MALDNLHDLYDSFNILVIEDTLKGMREICARLVAEREGIHGAYRFLVDEEGKAYLWMVIKSPFGPGVIQRLINFSSWQELEIQVGKDWVLQSMAEGLLANSVH